MMSLAMVHGIKYMAMEFILAEGVFFLKKSLSRGMMHMQLLI